MSKRLARLCGLLALMLLTGGLGRAADNPWVLASLTTGEMIPGSLYTLSAYGSNTGPFTFTITIDPRTTVETIFPLDPARAHCKQTTAQEIECSVDPGDIAASVFVNVRYSKIIPCKYGLKFSVRMGSLVNETAASNASSCNRVFLPAFRSGGGKNQSFFPIFRR